jgi:hypothetical protein
VVVEEVSVELREANLEIKVKQSFRGEEVVS